jgi:hypothetical protein
MNKSNGYFRAFFDELGRLGYVEGQNLSVERYSGEGRIQHFAELAHDVVSTAPDLIYAMSGPIRRRRQQYPLSQYPLIR